jgi:hypothetical protein
MSRTNDHPLLLDFQKVLEHNEDIIAAIVENMQLGRMEDSINHYMVLQSNLVSLGDELDNYPAGEFDLYDEANSFPDEIMRKDVLEDLLPHGSRTLPKPPLAPPCWKCAEQNVRSICLILIVYLNAKLASHLWTLNPKWHSSHRKGVE